MHTPEFGVGDSVVLVDQGFVEMEMPWARQLGLPNCLSGGQEQPKATPVNIAAYVYKMLFHTVQKLIYGMLLG